MIRCTDTFGPGVWENVGKTRIGFSSCKKQSSVAQRTIVRKLSHQRAALTCVQAVERRSVSQLFNNGAGAGEVAMMYASAARAAQRTVVLG